MICIVACPLPKQSLITLQNNADQQFTSNQWQTARINSETRRRSNFPDFRISQIATLTGARAPFEVPMSTMLIDYCLCNCKIGSSSWNRHFTNENKQPLPRERHKAYKKNCLKQHAWCRSTYPYHATYEYATCSLFGVQIPANAENLQHLQYVHGMKTAATVSIISVSVYLYVCVRVVIGTWHSNFS